MRPAAGLVPFVNAFPFVGDTIVAQYNAGLANELPLTNADQPLFANILHNHIHLVKWIKPLEKNAIAASAAALNASAANAASSGGVLTTARLQAGFPADTSAAKQFILNATFDHAGEDTAGGVAASSNTIVDVGAPTGDNPQTSTPVTLGSMLDDTHDKDPSQQGPGRGPRPLQFIDNGADVDRSGFNFCLATGYVEE